MAGAAYRVLIVENDPVVTDFLNRQALAPDGCQVLITNDVSAGIDRALQAAPDLILVDASLPGLSGKEMAPALRSQGLEIPVVVMGQRGLEGELLQALRLGAANYLLLPCREQEVVDVAHQVLQQTQERRQRERDLQRALQSSQNLQARVHDLTNLAAYCKNLAPLSTRAALCQKIIDGAALIAQADMGWLLLRVPDKKKFERAASFHLPADLPVDDSFGAAAAISGEPLTMEGEPLRRFHLPAPVQSALAVPIRIHNQTAGLICLLREKPAAFTAGEQALLVSLAEYSAIALANLSAVEALR